VSHQIELFVLSVCPCVLSVYRTMGLPAGSGLIDINVCTCMYIQYCDTGASRYIVTSSQVGIQYELC